jgi:hypothetical protein
MKVAEVLKAEAAERLTARNWLSPFEQLQKLDRTLGVGVGAHKERVRLHREIAETKARRSKPRRNIKSHRHLDAVMSKIVI